MEEFNRGKEIDIQIKDMIVSSTDKKGNIIYVNDIFCEVAGYKREDLIGQPHSIIRHPDMPKVIFYFLWQTVMKGDTIYAFVKNKAQNGDYYWVKAYVKPIMEDGKVKQFTSYRKPINNFAKGYIEKLYATLIDYEKTHTPKETLDFVLEILESKGLDYERFIRRLSLGKGVELLNLLDIAKYRNAHIIYKYHIIDAVKNGNTDIEVTSSTMCEFGKMYKSLENEPFTSMPQWQTMLKYHNHVHTALQDYVEKAKQGASSSILEDILNRVEADTKIIFDNLTQVIDGYKG
ncbi:MAG: PAS domain S-box protein [Arcobacteraceae bacterium]|nr:PAS domain S-box protein [Arcobacteraceae bacterium]